MCVCVCVCTCVCACACVCACVCKLSINKLGHLLCLSLGLSNIICHVIIGGTDYRNIV